jgi:hypothetical protein
MPTIRSRTILKHILSNERILMVTSSNMEQEANLTPPVLDPLRFMLSRIVGTLGYALKRLVGNPRDRAHSKLNTMLNFESRTHLLRAIFIDEGRAVFKL